MKPTIISVLLLSLILCGCSEKQSASARPAINRIRAHTETTWAGGYVLHVDKRNESSIEDIRIVAAPSNGPKTIITADSGTISAGANGTVTDQHTVKLTLHNVRIEKDVQTRKIVSTTTNMTIFLHE